MTDSPKKEIKCGYVSYGVLCDRYAIKYFRSNEYPHYYALCSHHVGMSAPRGHTDRIEISYEEIIMKMVMES